MSEIGLEVIRVDGGCLVGLSFLFRLFLVRTFVGGVW